MEGVNSKLTLQKEKLQFTLKSRLTIEQYWFFRETSPNWSSGADDANAPTATEGFRNRNQTANTVMYAIQQ